MNINNAFPSDYLKSGDLEGDLTLTIRAVETKSIGQGEQAELKPIVYFEEQEKGFVLNKTNALTISGMYGPETDNWTGKPITLFPTQVDFQGKSTLALRVRLQAKTAATKVQAAPAADLATGEQWEMFYSLAGTLDGKGITVPEPPEIITTQGMLKVLASLRARLAPKHNEASEIGFPEEEPMMSMTLEEANDVLNSEDVRYGDIETEKLSFMVNSLLKVKSPTPKQAKKLLAIRTILAARSLKEKVEQPV